MCYRIVSLRAISFLLELICTQFHRNVLQNCCVTYNSECISVPAKCEMEESYRIIRISKIRELSISHLCTNQFPLKLFIRNSVKRLYRISFLRIILRGISVPREVRNGRILQNYTQFCEETLQNFIFAYNSEGHLRPHSAFYTQFGDSPPLKSHICV